MAAGEDLARLTAAAQAFGLAIPPDDLARIAPRLAAVHAELERLRALPLDRREPAAVPLGIEAVTAAAGAAPRESKP